MTLWLADLVLRVTAVLGVAATTAVLLRRAPAAARHAVWLGALAGVLALPVLGSFLPRVAVPVPAALVTARPFADAAPVPLPAVTGTARRAVTFHPVTSPVAPLASADAPGTPMSLVVSDAETPTLAVVPAARAARTSRQVSASQGIALVWLFGAVALLGRLLGSLAMAGRLRRAATPVTDAVAVGVFEAVKAELGVRRPIRLLSSARALVPATWGWRRPVVMVPASARAWSLDRWRVVLLHEVTHVRRHDWLSQLLAHVACLTYWFNPLVWMGAHRLRLEGERACDEGVVRAGTRASDYAEHLLDIARGCHGADWAAATTVGMARGSQLEGRLLAILHPVRPGWLTRSAGYVAGGCVVATLLAVAAVQPAMRAQSLPVPTDLPLAMPAPLAGVSQTVPVPPAPPELPRVVTVPAPPPIPAPPTAPTGLGAALAQQRQAIEQVQTARDERAMAAAQAALDRARAQIDRATRQAERQMDQLWNIHPTVDVDFDYDFDFDRFVSAQFQGVPSPVPAPPAPAVDPRVADAFIAALRDTEPDVRAEAARALGRYRVASAAGPLTQALEDADPDVREEAARSLGRIGSPESLKALIGAMDDPDPDVREQAIDALASMRRPEAVPGLVAALRSSEPEIAERAARALGFIRDPASIEPLLAATRHPEPDVVEAALRSLSQFSDARAIDALTSAMTHENADVRRLALSMLSRSRFVTVECRDGVDNDGDGLIDAADTDCR